METDLARKVAEAIQSELAILELQAIVDAKEFNLAALPELWLRFKAVGLDHTWALDDPCTLASVVASDASLSLEFPIQKDEHESFKQELVKRINVLLEKVPVAVTIDTEREFCELQEVEKPDEIDSFEIEPLFTTGDLENEAGEYTSLNKALSTEALDRIKGSIEWPVIEDDTDAYTSGTH